MTVRRKWRCRHEQGFVIIEAMPTDRERWDEFRDRHSGLILDVERASRELVTVAMQWLRDVPPPSLRDQTDLAARDLLDAVDRMEAVMPVGIPSVDGPLR